MKVEVCCPDCNNSWHVEQSAGGEMLCPSCMTRIPLDGSSIVRSVDAAEVIRTDSAPAATVASPASTAEPAASPAAPADWMYEPVVCPRCNLHFRPRRRPDSSPAARKTILVVDDLAYFRQMAKDALEPTFDVKTAASEAEARDVLSRTKIDLLVLDLTLGRGEAGRDLLRELSPKPCPILIFTAQDESEMYGENWEELQRLGADDLVIKGMQVAESLVRKASVLLGIPVDDGDMIG